MKRERKPGHIQSTSQGKGGNRSRRGDRRAARTQAIQETISTKTKALWLLIIVTLTVTAYYPAYDNEITSWDDEFYINNNPYLELNKENVFELFRFDTSYMGNYHPLSMISLSIDYAIGGTDEDGNIKPFMFLFTNILLHIFVSLFVFWFILALLKNFQIAVISALLFAVHTLHVESVAWISERKDVLYAFFFVASLIAYLKYVDSKKVTLYIISIALFILSLLSKGQAVSLAVTIILIDFIRKRKLLDIKLIAEKIPFLALAVFFGLIAIGAQKESEALVDEQAYSLVQRIGIAAYAFMQYVFKLILPVNLSAIYPYPDIIGQSIPPLYYFMIIPVLLIAGLFFWLVRKEKNVLVFGIAFFVINIALLLQFIPVGSAVHADRYAYIPSIGFFLIVSVLLVRMIEKNSRTKMIIYGLTVLYAALLLVLTVFRTDVWKDSLTLWTDTTEKSPKSVVAWNNLGSQKDKEGAKAMDEMNINEAKELRLEAIQYFTKAIDGKPDYKNAYYNRGISRLEVGKIMQDSLLISLSINDFTKAIEQDAQFADAYHNRANGKSELGNLDGAIKDFDLAIALKPDDANYYTNRGVTKGKAGHYQSAIEDFNSALKINPDEPAVFSNRGRAKMLMNQIQEAIEDYNKAVELDPTHYSAYFNRAFAKQRQNDFSGALEDFSKTIDLNPNLADAHYFRALILIQNNQIQAACDDLNQAKNKGFTRAENLIHQYCK
jgi:tetratricopeptide (TPR) repeat protein